MKIRRIWVSFCVCVCVYDMYEEEKNKDFLCSFHIKILALFLTCLPFYICDALPQKREQVTVGLYWDLVILGYFNPRLSNGVVATPLQFFPRSL